MLDAAISHDERWINFKLKYDKFYVCCTIHEEDSAFK